MFIYLLWKYCTQDKYIILGRPFDVFWSSVNFDEDACCDRLDLFLQIFCCENIILRQIHDFEQVFLFFFVQREL